METQKTNPEISPTPQQPEIQPVPQQPVEPTPQQPEVSPGKQDPSPQKGPDELPNKP